MYRERYMETYRDVQTRRDTRRRREYWAIEVYRDRGTHRYIESHGDIQGHAETYRGTQRPRNNIT